MMKKREAYTYTGRSQYYVRKIIDTTLKKYELSTIFVTRKRSVYVYTNYIVGLYFIVIYVFYNVMECQGN